MIKCIGFLCMLVVILGCEEMARQAQEKRDSEAKAKAEAEAQRVADSTAQAESAALHQSRMKTDKRYRDSVTKAETQRLQDSIDVDRRERPERHIKVNMSWHRGGFGRIGLADITITNNSLVEMRDPSVLVVYKSESGNELGSKMIEFQRVWKSGETRKMPEHNLGFLDENVHTMSCKFVAARWGE